MLGQVLRHCLPDEDWALLRVGSMRSEGNV